MINLMMMLLQFCCCSCCFAIGDYDYDVDVDDGGDVDWISFAFDIVCVHGFDLININAFGIFEAHQQLG